VAHRTRAPRDKTERGGGLAYAIAVGGGLGRVPGAPGTAGSLLGLAVAAPLLALDWRVHLAAAVLCTAGALLVCVQASPALESADPPAVIIDEVAGMLVAAIAVPATLYELGAVFLLFRLFDVVKPAPLPRLERLPGGLGILADDVAAGLLARATWWLLKVNFDFL
jgi:phosphatidylglycerophosphatase A